MTYRGSRRTSPMLGDSNQIPSPLQILKYHPPNLNIAGQLLRMLRTKMKSLPVILRSFLQTWVQAQFGEKRSHFLRSFGENRTRMGRHDGGPLRMRTSGSWQSG